MNLIIAYLYRCLSSSEKGLKNSARVYQHYFFVIELCHTHGVRHLYSAFQKAQSPLKQYVEEFHFNAFITILLVKVLKGLLLFPVKKVFLHHNIIVNVCIIFVNSLQVKL